MSALQRVFRGPVMFTLHTTDPGPNGSGRLTRLVPVPGTLFSITNGQAVNTAPVELQGSGQGRATWIALWLDGVVAGKDRLLKPVEVSGGATIPFGRGDLRVGWQP